MTKTSLAAFAALAVLTSGCFDSDSDEDSPSSGEPTVPPARIQDTTAVRVVEICAGNTSLVDQFGEDPGWLELENRSADTVDLSRYRLSGKAKDTAGWQLPSLKLPPGARQIIFASGRDLAQQTPASDSITPKITSSGRWADGDASPTPGLSRVRNWEYGSGKYYGYLPPDSTLAYSWTLFLGDNKKVPLDWSSAEVTVNFATLDLSSRDRVWIEATIPLGQPILVGLCQGDVECWKAPQHTLVGTGKRLDRYDFALAEFKGSRARSGGFRFTPPKNLIGDFRLTLSKFGFYTSGSHPHAGFKLDRDGATLVLHEPARGIHDSVKFPALEGDASWARDPATGKWGLLEKGTPGIPNPPATRATVLEPPEFATAPGFHTAPFPVRVKPLAGLQIRCALGGALPTAASPLADAGIILDSSNAVSCAGFAPDGTRGPVATGTFLLDTPKGLGVIAITADSASLYDTDTGMTTKGPNASTLYPYMGANFWKEKEIPAHVELFENGGRAFALRSGISIFGNYSRAAPKKSFSVQFRETYGPTHLKHPLFPHHPQYTKFKGFGLRNNGGNYGNDYVRDALMASLTEPRGQDYQLSRHVVVYIN
ncbi:MAG TPA: hypothetical protein PKY05_06860, partial [Fibrobacteria bacterium]|nr:hypothetical protein [Fibrobacteria bacterium]